MPNEFNVTRPILIGGAGRSGTTWVLEWLSKAPTVQSVIENSLAYVTYQQLCSSWWSEIFQKVECSEQKDVQWEKAVKVIRNMLCDLFPSNRPLWAMKIIWGVESIWGVPLDFWRLLFPEARYIHCTRHPLTCLPSIVRYLGNYSGYRTIPEAEASFIRGHRDMLRLKSAGVHYTQIPLEDVERDAKSVWRKLAAFCGLDGPRADSESLQKSVAGSAQRFETAGEAGVDRLQ